MAVFKAGSFTKTANAGATTQDVAHGLGVTPKALIIWHAGSTASATFGNFATPFLTFTDQDRNSIGIGTGHTDSDAGGDSGSRYGAYALVQVNGSNAGFGFNATVSAWDDTNFTLSYPADSTSTSARIIGFLAIGGADVSSKVVDHTLDGDTGADPITGAGFTPTSALMLFGGNLTGVLPVANANDGLMSMGAVDGTSQWCMGYSVDDDGSGIQSRRAQRTDNCLISLDPDSDALTWLGSFTSFDSDGMTLDITTAGTAASHLGVLFLRGATVRAGHFEKDDSGDVNAVDTVATSGVNPQAIMLASYLHGVNAGIVDHGRLHVGFSDGTNEYAANINIEDNLATSNVSSYLNTAKAFHQQNNDTQTTTGLADATMGTRQFQLTWTTNFATPTHICFMAFGDAAPGGPGGGGGQGGGKGNGNGGGNGGGGGNPGGGPPGGGGNGNNDNRFFMSTLRKRRKFFGGF
jgi:hypothetical protein